jgi:signal transduction histidine kinase
VIPLEGSGLLIHIETAPALPPGRSLAPRRVLPLILLLLAATVGLGLVVHGRSFADGRFLLAEVGALANLLGALALCARARTGRSEAPGWWLLGVSLALLAAANLSAAMAVHHLARQPSRMLGPVLLGVAGQALAGAGLLVLPWGTPGLRWRARNVLGSGLFVGSLLALQWTLADWHAGFGPHHVVNLVLLGACARILLLGAPAMMLLEQDPRRIRGVLGFVLGYALLGGLAMAVLQAWMVRGWQGGLPLASIQVLAPLLLGLAAWSRSPLEFPDRALASNRLWESIPYATFALAAGAILLSFLVQGTIARVPLIAFIMLTWLLLCRQFLLLRDLRRQNQSLERRVQDRTRDLEAMQAVVLRTERLNTMSTLGAGIAHDLNNFLGVIHASVQMIEQEREDGGPMVDRHLARIHASSEHAASLTRRLLGFARKGQDSPELLELGEELAQLEDLLRILLPRSIGLSLEREPGTFPVLTRKSSLEQILVNLVGNAKDAMPDGGTVRIRLAAVADPEDPRIQFQVEDTGPGLPPVVLEHLFELFTTTKAEGQGTGLGLATVKALVEGDGGTVSVQNGPEGGCRFVISYPLALVPEPLA